jgi:hypothetical protein
VDPDRLAEFHQDLIPSLDRIQRKRRADQRQIPSSKGAPEAGEVSRDPDEVSGGSSQERVSAGLAKHDSVPLYLD